MFVVTIEQGDAGFEVDCTHWTRCASYVIKAQTVEGAEYEALYRWVQDSYHGSIIECLKVLGQSGAIRVTAFSGDELGQLEKIGQYKIAPYLQWRRGRTANESPVHCTACNWYGSMKQMVHKYRLNSQQEIEPADFCPACGAPLI